MIKANSNSPLISIIVPVYNVELYLYSCAKSLLNQTYADLEIILVNDGSTDSSGDILKKLSREDDRVVVLNKENGGASSARNAGLEKASGEYIIFVDSDDWVDKGFIEKMYRTVKKYDADIVSCGMRYVNTAGKSRENVHGPHVFHESISGIGVYSSIISELSFGGGSLCCRLINRDLIGGTRFIESMHLSEDQEWLLRILNKISTMVYIPDVLYNVRVRPGSATTKSRASDVEDIARVDNQIISWAKKNRMTESAIVRNALFVRSRLKYSSAVRSQVGGIKMNALRAEMIARYKKVDGIQRSEKIKYAISLLPPQSYLLARSWLKRIRREIK